MGAAVISPDQYPVRFALEFGPFNGRRARVQRYPTLDAARRRAARAIRGARSEGNDVARLARYLWLATDGGEHQTLRLCAVHRGRLIPVDTEVQS